MGTQTTIAQAIVDKGADYCLALKGNHPLLHADVERFIAAPTSDGITTASTTDGDHGRIETRIHSVCHDVSGLFSDRRYTDERPLTSAEHEAIEQSKADFAAGRTLTIDELKIFLMHRLPSTGSFGSHETRPRFEDVCTKV